MPAESTPPDEAIVSLNRLLIKVLRELADSGREHEACMFAAEGLSLLRRVVPREAQRLDGLLHYLTAPNRQRGASGAGAAGRAHEGMC